ncbi:hypothetical protein J6590_006444 [Homalodisca vitripennis]|nr:hypothetical protein J6590_006444 [Homalodisca vitripennis]
MVRPSIIAKELRRAGFTARRCYRVVDCYRELCSLVSHHTHTQNTNHQQHPRVTEHYTVRDMMDTGQNLLR